ncbi:hypothetical protein ACHMW6_14040 [Pseudoduganella sp. UC29_106]|uniref:hypothetical protein n=1 Tax=Pseudoduganella sp. UC29_106 TaxID=3374553 RepID=UPI00375675EB
MQLVRTLRAGSAGITLLMCSAAMAQLPQENRSNAELSAELETLKKQLADQRQMLQTLQEDLKRLKNPVAAGQLEQARGTGTGQAGGQPQSQPQPQPAQTTAAQAGAAQSQAAPGDSQRTAAQGRWRPAQRSGRQGAGA